MVLSAETFGEPGAHHDPSRTPPRSSDVHSPIQKTPVDWGRRALRLREPAQYALQPAQYVLQRCACASLPNKYAVRIAAAARAPL